MSVKLIYITKNYSQTIEKAARASTDTKTEEEKLYEWRLQQANGNELLIEEDPNDDIEMLKKSEDFVRRLVKRGHLSVGRHCMAAFEVTGSRAFSHQWVRHVHLNYTQESQRYVTFDNDFIMPESIKSNATAKLFFKNTCDKIKEGYEELIEMGVPREDARYLLPNACQTRIFTSGNFNAWWDFLELRTDPHAQKEIRDVAFEIKDILLREAPAFFEPLFEKIEQEKQDKINRKEKLLIEKINSGDFIVCGWNNCQCVLVPTIKNNKVVLICGICGHIREDIPELSKEK